MIIDRRFAALLVFAWIVQITIVPHIAIGPVMPDVILIVVATYGFLAGPMPGGAAGIVGGFLQDLTLISGFGINIINKTVIGYLAGLVERNLFGSSRLIPMIAMFVVSVISQFTYLALVYVVGERIEVVPAIINIIIPSALYTSVIAFFLFAPINRVMSHERQETVFK